MLNEKRLKKIEALLNKKQSSLEIFLESVYSSQNLSAIMRSAEGVGVLNIYYSTQNNETPKIHKTITQGAHRWTHRYRINDNDRVNFIKQKKSQGLQIIVTHLNENAISFREVDYTNPTLIIMGNEKDGVSSEIINEADEVIIIPMKGMVQSLNVSVASALVLYEAQRQREGIKMYDTPSLNPKEIQKIKEEWIYRDTIARRSKGTIALEFKENWV